MNRTTLTKAIRAAKHSDVKCAKVVAVVSTYTGTPLFAVSNRRSSDPHRWTDHAEVRAIKSLRRRSFQDDLTLTVLRFRSDGSMAIAKPCQWCQYSIEVSGLFEEVYYSNEKGILELLKFH